MHSFIRSLFYLGISSFVVIAASESNQPLQTALAQTSTTPTEASQAKSSSQAAIDLARHLTKVNARMYGAYWCPHCTHQREVFGEKAFALVDYIECAADGKNAQPERCKTEEIQGYPTWKINGKTYLGVHSLEELANLSGYRGSRNF